MTHEQIGYLVMGVGLLLALWLLRLAFRLLRWLDRTLTRLILGERRNRRFVNAQLARRRRLAAAARAETEEDFLEEMFEEKFPTPVNPATGLPMFCGVDTAGNPYGEDHDFSVLDNPP